MFTSLGSFLLGNLSVGEIFAKEIFLDGKGIFVRNIFSWGLLEPIYDPIVFNNKTDDEWLIPSKELVSEIIVLYLLILLFLQVSNCPTVANLS